MNEEELDKYIKGKFEEIHSKMLNKQFVSAGTLIRFRDACFQKGKLEQKKEEIIFLQDLIFQDSITIIKEDVRDKIKQLQKEIGGEEVSLDEIILNIERQYEGNSK